MKYPECFWTIILYCLSNQLPHIWANKNTRETVFRVNNILLCLIVSFLSPSQSFLVPRMWKFDKKKIRLSASKMANAERHPWQNINLKGSIKKLLNTQKSQHSYRFHGFIQYKMTFTPSFAHCIRISRTGDTIYARNCHQPADLVAFSQKRNISSSGILLLYPNGGAW